MTYFSTIQKNSHSRKNQQGFTLIELLVAVAVFAILATFSLGSVLGILDAGRKAKSLNSVMTNLNFTMEVMSREIRFGNSYHCGDATPFTLASPPSAQNCTGGGGVTASNTFSFLTNDGIPTIYKLNTTTKQILKSTDGGTSFVGVTAPEVVIQDLKFFVFNSVSQAATTPDNAQSKVIVLVRGYAGTKPTTQSSFTLQATLSQRPLDRSAIVSVPVVQTAYRYVKWVVTQRRCADNSIQVNELVLLQNGSPVTWPSGSTATNPGGSNPQAPNFEVPSKVIDGDTSSKWLDFNFDSDAGDPTLGSSVLKIDTGIGNSVTFNGYRWTTANDANCRDPIGWTLYGSNDDATYTTLSSQSNQAIPFNRSGDSPPGVSPDYSF